jgi:hypothetical protein
MKKLLLSLSAMALLATASFAQAKADDIAKIQVETIDLGKIPQGTPATATYIVTNIGKTDLIIESANPTCGCTVGDYTKTPIAPGKTGTITATFNAASLGIIDKHMTVKFAGADDMKSIGFKGEVLDATEYAKMKGGIPPAVVTNVPAKANVKSPKVTAVKNKVKTKKVAGKVAA